MVIVWSIDGSTVKNFIQLWTYHPQHYLHQNIVNPLTSLDQNNNQSNNISQKLDNTPKNTWISTHLQSNFTSNLLARWLDKGGEPC